MNIEDRGRRLNRIYELYELYTADMDCVCARRCSACCTCNVTGTTLEGWFISEYMIAQNKDPNQLFGILYQNAPDQRYQPVVTTNELVTICFQGQEPPSEHNDPSAGGCPLLDNDLCPVYDVRPFGCRAMISTIDCSYSGEAHMPPLVLSINNMVMQFIEALDRPGASGNMLDVFGFLSKSENHKAYIEERCQQWGPNLHTNQPYPVLMVPPEHRPAVQSFLRALRDAVA